MKISILIQYHMLHLKVETYLVTLFFFVFLYQYTNFSSLKVKNGGLIWYIGVIIFSLKESLLEFAKNRY